MTNRDKTVKFLDYSISALNLSELKCCFFDFQNASKVMPFQLCSAHAFFESEIDAELEQIFQNSLLISDGKPLTLYLKFKNPRIQQIRGADFMRMMLKDSPRDIHHAFIGSTDKNLSALKSYAEGINSTCKYSTLSPGFTDDVQNQLQEIREFVFLKKPDVIWIGLGAPKQFKVAYSLAREIGRPVAAVGAAFDFLTGNKPEAPSLIQRLGLEWMFRLFQEPRRLFLRYLYGNSNLLRMIFLDLFLYIKNKKWY